MSDANAHAPPPPSPGTSPALRVVLGVGAGIAAYKSAELVRRLREVGCDVIVVLTAHASRFVGAATFQALSGNPVRTTLWDGDAEAAMGHIELARWADVLLIAPATANLLARLAHGLADDLLTTLALATRAPLWLAPAMNQAMWAHPATQANSDVLRARGAEFLGPDSGAQACGDVGAGRMVEPETILAALAAFVAGGAQQLATRASPGPLHGVRVLVTAGPTFEDIDPVRYLGNRSSGRMGFALADAAQQAGAEVTVIAGPVALACPRGVARVDVRSAQEMFAAVESRVGTARIFIGAAAVADYRVRSAEPHKITKSDDALVLELVPTTDIIAAVAARVDRPFTVGFAAETRNLAQHARAKLERKRLDLVIANPVDRPDSGFDVDRNEALALWPGGERMFPPQTKSTLATALVALIAERYHATANARA